MKLTKGERKRIKRQKINDIQNEINRLKQEQTILRILLYDWKELSEEVYDEWEKSINELGGHFILDPECHGSDCFIIVISKQKVDLDVLAKINELKYELGELI